jgi:hypothetical protein
MNQKNHENRRLTCFQRRRTRPNVPPSRRRNLSKPTSIIRSNTVWESIVGMKLSKPDSNLTGSQNCCVGSHAKRSYGWNKSSGSKIIKIGYSLVRHLLPNHLCMGFQVFCRRGEAKGLTLEVERNADPPYSDRQRHNNLISFPNRDTSGVNEHLIPETCR